MEAIIRNQLHREATTGELNSGIQVTIPDQSMSISEILQYSMEHTEVLDPIPDIPYGLDLTDIYPNIDEFPDTDNEFNPIKNDNDYEGIEVDNKDSQDTAGNLPDSGERSKAEEE